MVVVDVDEAACMHAWPWGKGYEGKVSGIGAQFQLYLLEHIYLASNMQQIAPAVFSLSYSYIHSLVVI